MGYKVMGRVYLKSLTESTQNIEESTQENEFTSFYSDFWNTGGNKFYDKNKQPKIVKLNIFNNKLDIEVIKSYADFQYENGDVYVNGIWYKTPYEALNNLGSDIIKDCILKGQVKRKLGLGRIY